MNPENGKDEIFTHFMHQHSITNLIAKCLKNAKNKYSQNVMLKTTGVDLPQKVKWSILPLTNIEGSIVGAIIVAGPGSA